MKCPVYILKEAAKVRKRKYTSKGEEYVPTYKEMRESRIKPDMTTPERWALRGKHVQRGYTTGTIAGGLAGGWLGYGLGRALQGMKVLPKGRTSDIISKWVLPPITGYPAYRLGGNYGKIYGERKARKVLEESGNPIEEISPLSLSDRGAFDPHFMSTMVGLKIMQAASKDIGQEAVDKTIKNPSWARDLMGKLPKYIKGKRG